MRGGIMTKPFRFLLALVATLALVTPAPAQTGADLPLEDFVQHVASLWASGDVSSLVDLIPADNRVLLDTGSGSETANARHASAALRALFAERETLGARAVRVTVSSSRPPRGFGELAWAFRDRGAPGEQARSVYVAALREERGWRISELRIMR